MGKRKILFLFLLLISVFTFYNLYFCGKIYPNITIAGIAVGAKTPKQAAGLLKENFTLPEKINLATDKISEEWDIDQFSIALDTEASVQRAYNLTRTGNLIYDFTVRAQLLFKSRKLGVILNKNQTKVREAISDLAVKIEQEPVYPSAKLEGGKVIINRGSPGKKVDNYFLQAIIYQSLSLGNTDNIQIPLGVIDPTLNEAEVKAFQTRAEKLANKIINLKLDTQAFKYKDNRLLALLDAKNKYSQKEIDKIIFEIASGLNCLPQNPTFVYLEGKVSEFAPAKDGIEVISAELKQNIISALQTLEETDADNLLLEIPIKRSPPELQTKDINNLGIRELIGRGSSRFKGSIASRIYNIGLAAAKINGILVKPGETFSFNKALGDVSKFTGYKEAYIIKEGKTILGDGGGVCQVSSTLFRAALNTGLPIVERRAHAYRVGYYEQDSLPGLDATVYDPSPDLKIKNDTPGHILIQAKVDKKNNSLVFELYGTGDARIATVSKSKISDITPPPEDLYIDDSSLPQGSIKQIDYKAWGAKVVFDYHVKRGGQIIFEKKFVSNYSPWQAVYLRGTKH